MKLHDLRPAAGSRTERVRVGRGIAAGKGKTAGRGTKGQKSRTGGTLPPGFEGGQTPLHQRIPKLRGFKVRGRVEYEVVNVGAIARLAEQGAFERDAGSRGRGSKAPPTTINQDILRGVGLVRTLARPMKVLGQGDLATPLFVVADAFSRSAVSKIEAAGGSVSVLERSVRPTPALGVAPEPEAADGSVTAGSEPEATETAVAETDAQPTSRPARRSRTKTAAQAEADAPAEGAVPEAVAKPEADGHVADAVDGDGAAPTSEADAEAPESTTPVDEA
jgi:large subunit ribosomal protein L15